MHDLIYKMRLEGGETGLLSSDEFSGSEADDEEPINTDRH
jgi:hypothetical protein